MYTRCSWSAVTVSVSSTRHTCFLSCPVAFLLARELFKFTALKFNFSSEWNEEKSYAPEGANTALIYESTSRTRRTRTRNCNAKDDATTTAQAKFKERKFFELWLKKYSWLGYEKNDNYMYCRVCRETWKSNGMRNETQPKFSKYHAHSTCSSRRTQGGFPRS